VQFGTKITGPPPGSTHGLYLIVSDIEVGRDELVRRGAKVTEVFHSGAPGAQLDPEGTSGRISGPDPNQRSYSSFATFEDPDGNSWLLQEVTDRLPGRVDPTITSFNSARDVAAALRRAASAHGEHEKRIGRADEDWPDWYAEYMVREQNGRELPRSWATTARGTSTIILEPPPFQSMGLARIDPPRAPKTCVHRPPMYHPRGFGARRATAASRGSTRHLKARHTVEMVLRRLRAATRVAASH
jgi:hypothetical protein